MSAVSDELERFDELLARLSDLDLRAYPPSGFRAPGDSDERLVVDLHALLLKSGALCGAVRAPAPAAFSETIQRAVDVFQRGTEEQLGEWRMREGRAFVDEMTRLIERAQRNEPQPKKVGT